MAKQVVIMTIASAGKLPNNGIVKHFTNIFIDEAGHAIETESLSCFIETMKPNASICLAGDPKQLGPIIRSELARFFGFETSLLERLYMLPISTKFISSDGTRGMQQGSLIEGMNLTDHETIYINGAAPPFSTPRAVRFVVLEKDDGLQAVQVPDLAWALCHDYPNWTGPIKVPSLVQMAHNLAELAGNYDECGDSINNSRFANTMQIPTKTKTLRRNSVEDKSTKDSIKDTNEEFEEATKKQIYLWLWEIALIYILKKILLQMDGMGKSLDPDFALKMRNLFYKTYVHTTIFPIHSQTLDFATHNPGERDISHNPVQTGTRSYQFFFLQKYVSNSFSHYLFF